MENGERTKPTASMPPRARVAARARMEWSPVGASRPMPCAVPPLTTSRWPCVGIDAAAVAEGLAALERVDVEDRRGHRQGAAVAEPQVGADAGAEGEVGVGRASAAELGLGQVASEDGAGSSPAAPRVVDQPGDLAEVRGDVERQVHGHAPQAGQAALGHDLAGRGELAAGHAVAAHARSAARARSGRRVARR